MKSLFTFARYPLFILVVLAWSACVHAQDNTSKPSAAEEASKESPGAATENPYAYVLMKTNWGDILLRLDRKLAPISTENFLQYVKDGAYDGTIFHRVIDGFMIQGGGFDTDYEKRSTRAPIKNEWTNGLQNKLGTIAMARTSAPDSATCQFFINDSDNTQLDQPRGGAAYAVFGHVIAGMDVVAEISQTSKQNRGGAFSDAPAEAIVIEKASQVDLAQAEKIVKAQDKPATVCTEATPNEVQAVERSKRIQEAMKQAEENRNKLTKMDVPPRDLPGIRVDRPADGENVGLRWWILEKGTGDPPAGMNDTVTVHYSGYLLDGTKFDSSVDRGQPASFRLGGVIQGWSLGVGKMKVGEKKKLLIPGKLGYGARGNPNAGIPSNATLVFDVELIEIKPAKNPR